MQPTVLIIEDESDVADLLRHRLTKAKFRVLLADNGTTGLQMAQENRPQVIILDLMLPGLSGLEICRILKSSPDTSKLGILVLTAKGNTDARIKGLELGADDYVSKPFSPKEIVLRVQALLRRTEISSQGQIVQVDTFQIDKNALTISVEGKRLDLTTTEFKLLTLLLENRGRILDRETLLRSVWEYQNAVDTRTVDTHMRRLREKLGSDARRIETVRGEGYRFSTTL